MNTAADDFASRLLAWYDRAGRHDLPWMHPRTPYRVWLSEIMLQQTQVQTVMPYFERFVAALPTLPALAAASQDDVLALWSGLGYYARARNLHAAAKLCVERHDGELPRDPDALTALPGIGRSTAGAILAQAWGDRFAILDGNVKRVLARFHGVAGWPGTPAVEKALWLLAESHLPHERLADYTQAQMDFGATLCTRHDPACVICPLQADCVALRDGRVAELPTAKPSKPIPERHALLLLAEDAGQRVLLQKRPPTGIWASLWSLPEAADHETARAWFASHLQGDYDHAEALAPIAHAFTHYHVQLQPLRWRGLGLSAAVRDNDDLRWVARDELVSLGIPAPVRKLLLAVIPARSS
ncbi:A/G-specific adenine glycosylase [Luteimonas sp. SX5]|uniref:Adenine DNA glycosylase n=1 Tax=Luteimonas galliterrae TaxID=2940486 RepID=A0ABT0MDX4_9GAMM|nr:A/G-specific adenine glycosylase [Luteimonas galliterrae]MCL1633069.1 A/G-specific adenine glycosylase [Luteimonas galliterrae]